MGGVPLVMMVHRPCATETVVRPPACATTATGPPPVRPSVAEALVDLEEAVVQWEVLVAVPRTLIPAPPTLPPAATAPA
eukprot:1083677-Rhodomonas_salina.1